MKIVLQRWSGSNWYEVMLSPFNNHSEVENYLKKYWWHFSAEFPYRIK
jgi:hypothetical protein